MVIGHSVARLCARAAGYKPVFAEKAQEWSILDGYYVPTRYPNSLPDDIPSRVYTRAAADEAVQPAAARHPCPAGDGVGVSGLP